MHSGCRRRQLSTLKYLKNKILHFSSKAGPSVANTSQYKTDILLKGQFLSNWPPRIAPARQAKVPVERSQVMCFKCKGRTLHLESKKKESDTIHTILIIGILIFMLIVLNMFMVLKITRTPWAMRCWCAMTYKIFSSPRTETLPVSKEQIVSLSLATGFITTKSPLHKCSHSLPFNVRTDFCLELNIPLPGFTSQTAWETESDNDSPISTLYEGNASRCTKEQN